MLLNLKGNKVPSHTADGNRGTTDGGQYRRYGAWKHKNGRGQTLPYCLQCK